MHACHMKLTLYTVGHKKTFQLGEVGKFCRNFWLIYSRHCISISIKIGHVL